MCQKHEIGEGGWGCVGLGNSIQAEGTVGTKGMRRVHCEK